MRAYVSFLPRVQCITPIDASVAINHLPSNRSIIEDTSSAGGTCRAHPDVGSSPLHPFSLSLSSPLAERLLISAVGRCCTLLLRSFLNTRAQEEKTWAWVLESCCHDRERYRGRCSGRFSAGVGSTTGAQRMGRGERLVTVRFINRLVFVLVDPSPLPRSSLLENDDDDENLKKRTSPFCPSREQSVEQVLGSGISIVIVSCLREISRNKNRDRIAMKLFHACVGWFEERIGERVGDTITREMGVSWLVKRGYLHEFLLYTR